MAGRVEIVCDESGYEGDRLVGSTTALFAHSAVLISDVEAAAVMAELRRRIRSPATQYKATHLLRDKHRDVLEWFLGEDAPLRGRASVFVVHKAYYVLGRVVELLAGDGTFAPRGPGGREEAALLHRLGPGTAGWERLLETANGLLRRRGAAEPFFRAISEMRAGEVRAGAAGNGENGAIPAALDDLLGRLAAGVGRAAAYRVALAADPEGAGAAVDPLTPAILAAVSRWDADGGVTMAHDRQIMLSGARIARLRDWSGGRLAGVRFLVAEDEPRIQLADILAGTVRALGNSPLTRPFVDATSILPHP